MQQWSCDVNNFDFLRNVKSYDGQDKELRRLEKRHAFLIDPFKHLIEGATVLDIGAHDGRWSYALAAAGAKSVVGIEARQDQLAVFQAFPDDEVKRRVTLQQGDLYDTLDLFCAEGRQFDVITLYGIMYHVMDHFGILRKCLKLNPKVIIIDSEFVRGTNPHIQLTLEKTAPSSNAAPQVVDQDVAVIGIPSSAAIERMAKVLNCDIDWLPWEKLPEDERKGVQDYFRGKRRNRIRRTCALVPRTKATRAQSAAIKPSLDDRTRNRA